MHTVTLIPGDGVGPELTEAARRCIEATGVKIQWDVQHAGVDIMDREGTPIPDRVLDSIKRNRVALKGPITTPIGTGFRSVNVFLRQELNLYACLRPCKYYPGVRTFFGDVKVDLVVVRENTEDLYAGVEFERGTKETAELIPFINARSKKQIRTGPATTGVSIKPISIEGTRRIVQFAFDYARAYGRKRVTSVTKANIMKFTDGLFYAASRAVAKAYGAKFEEPKLAEGVESDPETDARLVQEAGPGRVGAARLDGAVEYQERLIDNMCMQLVQKPELYDVIVLPNLYGDILSDLCAGLVGGLGVAPGANIGTEAAIFEATHGSAPKYKGQNKVNPTAMILSGMLMLRHLNEPEAADRLERAVAAVIAEGKNVTYDLKPNRDDPTAVGTSQMADAIIRHM